MYVEAKRTKNCKLNLETIEKVILEYKIWIRETNREDKIENYEKFLQAE
jgi:D-mannonate dehydratase